MDSVRGKFIVIEGGDGAGKDTQIDLLKKEFGEEYIVYARDPGGTKVGQEIREMLQYGENIVMEAELFMFLASRAQLVQTVILPALREGKHVICNRYDLSTFAYQIYGRERHHEADAIKSAMAYARGDAMPDLIVFIDVAPAVGLARLEERGQKKTRFEEEEVAFHERLHVGYLAGLKEYPHSVIINGEQSIEAVYKEVSSAIHETIGEM